MRSIIKSLHAPLMMQNKCSFGSFSTISVLFSRSIQPLQVQIVLGAKQFAIQPGSIQRHQKPREVGDASSPKHETRQPCASVWSHPSLQRNLHHVRYQKDLRSNNFR